MEDWEQNLIISRCNECLKHTEKYGYKDLTKKLNEVKNSVPSFKGKYETIGKTVKNLAEETIKRMKGK